MPGKAALALLALLLVADIGFVWAHLRWAADDWYWDLGADTAYPEVFQYVQWGIASLLLFALAWKRRAAIYVAWAALFFFLLLDDAESFHERAGRWLAKTLDLKAFEAIYQRHFEYFMLYAQDFGELVYGLLLATIVVGALFLAWPGRQAKRERTVTKWLVGWLVLFAVFAVGFDMLHVMAWEIYPPAIELVAMIEDGGEMLCVSLLVGGLAFEFARDPAGL